MSESRKYLVLISVILVQACIGGTYAWSVFDRAFLHFHQMEPTLAALPFNLFYVVFPLTLLVARRIIAKLGTTLSAQLGIVLFAIGWGIASLGIHSVPLLFIGVGLVSGIGVGITYLIPIIVGVSWFPTRVGLVTGLAVGGFAFGAAVVSKLANYSIYSLELSPFYALAIIAVVYLVIGLTATMFMKPREEPEKSSEATSSWQFYFTDRSFLVLFFAMTSGLVAGFFINSKIVTLGEHSSEWVLSLVALFALANAIGRVAWGALSDKVGVNSCLFLNLMFQAISVFLLLHMIETDFAPNLLAVIAGFNYGGVLVLYATKARSKWGSVRFAHSYSLLFLSNILAALCNAGLNEIYVRFGEFPIAQILLAFLSVSAILVYLTESNRAEVQHV